MTTTCADCGAAAVFGLFDGARIRSVCAPCAATRCHGPVPDWTLGDGWILGHAAQTQRAFWNADQQRTELFARGAFRQSLDALVTLGVDHRTCRCREPGRSMAESTASLIDWALVVASTRDDTLWFTEDPYGLFFAAHVPREACVSYGADAAVNIHDAIGRGHIATCSLHGHGGDRVIGRAGLPADVFAFVRVALQEISLVLPPETPGSPGTWVRPADRSAMTALYGRLRLATADLSRES